MRNIGLLFTLLQDTIFAGAKRSAAGTEANAMSLGNWFKRFLQQIGAALGIGGLKLTMTVNGYAHPRGAPVSGEVIVEGGAVEQTIRHLNVVLCEFSANQTRNHNDAVYSTKTVAMNVIVKPGETLRFRWVFRIPDEARMTAEGLFGGKPTKGCMVQTEAKVAWMIANLTEKSLLNVEMHREIRAILSALRQMGFRDAQDLRSLFHNSSEAIRASFSAPAPYSEQMDGVQVMLLADYEMVSGQITIDWRDENLSERLRGVFGGNRMEIQINFPCKDLLTEDGQPDISGALEHLRKVLAEAMKLRANERMILLRPASAPDQEADILLRPASFTPAANPQELLRPAEEPEPLENRPKTE
jgi:sporulation-control protein spo0M